MVARVDLVLEMANTDGIDRAKKLIGGIVEAEGGSSTADPLPLFLLAALLAAIGAGIWAKLRIAGPIAGALDAAREFVHGQTEVRADAERGGRDAREVALAINALIDRAERL